VEDPRIREAIRKLESLPTLPQIATRIVNTVAGDIGDLDNLATLVESDPALSTRILKLVNSPSLGLGREVRTIRQAATILGLEGLKSHILGIHAFDALARNLKKHQWMRRGIWRHSLAVACTSEFIAQHTGIFDPSEASVAGLLHDIGIIALDYCFGKPKYEEVMNLMKSESISFLEAEETVLGLDHTLAGKWVAEKWNLPEFILAAIWLHHQGSTTPLANEGLSNLIRIVHLANTICSQGSYGFADSAVELMSINEQCENIGLSTEMYQDMLPRIGKYVEERADILGLDLYEKGLYLKALQSANRQQSRFIEELDFRARGLARDLNEFSIIRSFNARLDPASSVPEVLEEGAQTALHFLGAEKTVCFIVDRAEKYLLGKVSLTSKREAETLFVRQGREEGLRSEGLNGDKAILQELVSQLSAEKEPAGQFPAVPAAGKVAFIPFRIPRLASGGMFVDNRKTEVELAWKSQEVLAFAEAVSSALARAFLMERLRATSEKLVKSNRDVEAAHMKLLQAQKLASIGRMAAGAAHEMNNPLAIISGRAQLLADKKKAREELNDHLTVIREQCERLSKIISDLLNFARPVTPETEEQRLDEAVDAAIDNLSEQLAAKTIDIVRDIPKDLPKGAFDRLQIIQVFTNIIRNAIEAVKEQGTITISATASTREPFLIVKISDTGEGIEADHLDKVFEPFFSTKQAGRGTGLGLWVAYSIIEAHKGKMRVRSTLGKGTTFIIHIPMAQPDAGGRHGKKAADDVRGER
jgi:signal transduction histidine kinase/HD-like signal output (HDOD) protein